MSTTQEKRNSIIKDLKNLLIWISIALIIRWQVIEPRWIPSGSMLPTLQIQDKISCNNDDCITVVNELKALLLEARANTRRWYQALAKKRKECTCSGAFKP